MAECCPEDNTNCTNDANEGCAKDANEGCAKDANEGCAKDANESCAKDESANSAETDGVALPQEPAIFFFAGKPKSGKSVALRSILYSYFKRKHFAFGYAFVSTKFNNDYSFLPDHLVDDKYSDAKFFAYFQHLEKERAKLKNGEKLKPNFLVLDDLLGQVGFYKPEILQCFIKYRHTETYVFLTAQCVQGRGSSTLLREEANMIFLWRMNTASAVQVCYDAFGKYADTQQGKTFLNENDFVRTILDATAEPYRCLLVQSFPGEKCARFSNFKATPPPPFVVKFPTKEEEKEKSANNDARSLRQYLSSLVAPPPFRKSLIT
jgi:hypothetical protein